MCFSMAAEIERDLISSRIKEALKARKAAGVPKGPGKSKLDPFKEEIVALLKNGSTKKWVAKKYDCTLLFYDISLEESKKDQLDN